MYTYWIKTSHHLVHNQYLGEKTDEGEGGKAHRPHVNELVYISFKFVYFFSSFWAKCKEQE